MANLVMRGKVTLEDDIHRWFHFRYAIYSTLLIMSILMLPIVVIQFFGNAYLWDIWQLRFIGASVPLLLSVLMNFSNSLVETVINLIGAKSIIKYILELSKNSEDTTIIKKLTVMPETKSKDIDEEEVQETNLVKFILSSYPEHMTKSRKNQSSPSR